MSNPIEIVVYQEQAITAIVEQKNIEIIFEGGIQATRAHNQLTNLDYASSGHTGFASSAEVVKVTGDQNIEGNKTFKDNVHIEGDLRVDGAVNFINSNVVDIGDSIITLNADIPDDMAPTQDAGIQVKRGTETMTGIYWREQDDKWKVDDKKIAIEGDVLDGGTW